MAITFPRTTLRESTQPGGTMLLTEVDRHTGNVWFVHSGTGTNAAGYGHDPLAPFASVDYAFSSAAVIASQGDVIYVLPGHNEGALAVAIFDMDIAGVALIGLGDGAMRPTFDYDHASAIVSVGANNCSMKNLIFRPSESAVLIGVDIETGVTGTLMEDCEFANGEDGSGTDEFVKAVHLTSANHDTVIRNTLIRCHTSAGQATHGIHVDAASHRCIYDHVVIDGPYATNGILEDAAGADAIFRDCSIDVTGTNDGFHGNSTFAERKGNLMGGALEDTGANFIGVDDSNNVAATSNVAANEDGSVLERLEQIQEAVNKGAGTALAAGKSLVDALGTDGTTVTDAAASVLGAIGANNADNAFSSATVAANADGSVLERLEYIQGTTITDRAIEKSDGAMLNGLDDLFVVSGGPVKAQLFGIVTTVIGAVVATLQLRHVTTVPAATANMSTAVNVEDDAAGTSYRFVGATGVLTPDTAGAKIIDPVTVEDCWFLLPIGTLKVFGSAANTGVIKWYLRYVPLSASSAVAAAA